MSSPFVRRLSVRSLSMRNLSVRNLSTRSLSTRSPSVRHVSVISLFVGRVSVRVPDGVTFADSMTDLLEIVEKSRLDVCYWGNPNRRTLH